MANSCLYFLIMLICQSTKANGTLLFPNDLEELCPYTNFCNATRALSNISKSIIPCCRPCSCDEDCGRTRNCCTYDMDTYNRDTNNVSCVKATVHETPYDPPGTMWYYMVDTCLDGRSCNNVGNNATNGLYPHSSAAKGSVYFNKDCAHCNNDFDLIPWQAGFVCKQDITDKHLVALLARVDNLLNGQSDDGNCFYRFLPGANIATTTKECFPEWKIIRKCKPFGKNFDISEDMRMKCKLFNATFLAPGTREDLVYGNVYCALCSGQETEAVCGDDSAPIKAPTGSLMLILESTVEAEVTFGAEKHEYCTQVRYK